MSIYFVHFLIHHITFTHYWSANTSALMLCWLLIPFQVSKIIICLCCWLFSAFRVSKRRISYLLLTFYLAPGQQISPFLPFADLLPRSESANAAFLTFCWPFTSFRVSKRRLSHILLTFPNARIQQPPRIFHFADLSTLAGSASSITKYICWQKIKTTGAVRAQDPGPHRQFHKFLNN